MIKVKEGKLKFNGNGEMLLAELTCIINALYQEFSEKFGEENAKKLIKAAHELGIEGVD